MTSQEKFQITVPAKIEGRESFASFESQRTVRDVSRGRFNTMPHNDIGYDTFAYSFGGNSDISDGVNAASLVAGYERKPMCGADDLYTGEHMDHFYGEVVDEKGNCGFIERNNYMDRS